MIGERENKYDNTDYGTLHMQQYSINGNEINAFYDSSDNLVFVLDNTIMANKPNVLLVINPDGDRKWDEILSDDYDVDLETIRPKVDNKYRKLDIEYSGLNVYENLINSYNNGDSVDAELNQLNVLRDSAVRHSAMVRLGVANEIISKTNATIVKTKESVVGLQERIKTLRAKLLATKKEIGRVPTKQSASRVLKLESQIEALNEKLKRAKKRLDTAQKRLDVATVDAELAAELLNQPSSESKQKSKTESKNKSVVVAQKHEIQKIEPEYDDVVNDEDDEEDVDTDTYDDEDIDEYNDQTVKPLFKEDPQILNEDIAFKPVALESVSNVPELTPIEETEKEETVNTPNVPELPEPERHEEIPYLNDVFSEEKNKDLIPPVAQPVLEETKEEKTEEVTTEQPAEKPVLESLAPINNVPELSPDFESVIETSETVEEKSEEKPSVLDSMTSVEVRQSEPVVALETENLNNVAPIKNVELDNRLLAPMSESTHIEIIGETDRRKPTLIYYMLLLILIALSVFTLWLYQNNVDKNVTPTLTAHVEKTAVLKKASKPKKVVEKTEIKIDENEPVFLDEQPSKQDSVKTDTGAKESENVTQETSDAGVVDDTPVRVRSYDLKQEEQEEQPIVSEDDVLANKPVYEAGSKHDEMFVVENPDVQIDETDEVEYTDNENIDNENNEPQDDSDVEYVDENDPFYDAEEAEYQSEQNELDYEE